jgi:hypothetical protein
LGLAGEENWGFLPTQKLKLGVESKYGHPQKLGDCLSKDIEQDQPTPYLS